MRWLMCLCCGALLSGAMSLGPAAVSAQGPGWAVRIELRCRGLQVTREFCEAIAGRFVRRPGQSPDAPWRWLRGVVGQPGARAQARAWQREIDRSLKRGGELASLTADRAFVRLAEGRYAEALGDFVNAVEAAPTWSTPAEAALIALGMLWPALDPPQQHDGALALAGTLGARLHTVPPLYGRDYLPIVQLYWLANERERAAQVLRDAGAKYPNDADLAAASRILGDVSPPHNPLK